MKSHYIVSALILVCVLVGIGSIMYYKGGERHELTFEFENGATVYTWKVPNGDRTYDQLKLHPVPNEYNMPPFWSRDDLPEGKDLHHSFTTEENGERIWNYYFDVFQDGVKQYFVEKNRDSFCFASECGFAEIFGYRFASSKLVYPKALKYNVRRFYAVSGPMFWGRTKDAGPNNVFVYRGAEKRGPYAEVSSFTMVEGKPVYVARTTETSNTGTRKETLNSYAFVHDFKSIPVDCAVLNPHPAPPKTDPVDPEGGKEKKDEESVTPPPPAPPAPQNFVAVVAPFNAQLCGKDVKIGLDRLVEKSVANGREVTVETLYYSLDGVRHEIPAEATAPRTMVTPPNQNTAL
jgi:hypothetical protein